MCFADAQPADILRFCEPQGPSSLGTHSTARHKSSSRFGLQSLTPHTTISYGLSLPIIGDCKLGRDLSARKPSGVGVTTPQAKPSAHGNAGLAPPKKSTQQAAKIERPGTDRLSKLAARRCFTHSAVTARPSQPAAIRSLSLASNFPPPKPTPTLCRRF